MSILDPNQTNQQPTVPGAAVPPTSTPEPVVPAQEAPEVPATPPTGDAGQPAPADNPGQQPQA